MIRPRHRFSRTVVALLLLAAFGRATFVACGGWSESAAVRAACCHGSHCDQSAADDCCARGETQKHAQLLQAIAPAVVPAFQVIASASLVDVPIHRVDTTISALSHRPDTYLLLSVLLV